MAIETVKWLSTEQVGLRVGMTAEWVRRQVVAGRLLARVFRTGSRVTYRIRENDLRHFLMVWSIPTDDPDWEDFIEQRPGEVRAGH